MPDRSMQPSDFAERVDRRAHHTDRPTRVVRRVAVGGALGALPGLLIALIPLLLHEFGALTADQSQVGFIGVPVLIIGTAVGAFAAASDSGCASAVMLGIAAGFVAGLAGGLLVQAALRAAGVGLPVVWLLLTPIGMICGAALGGQLCSRRAAGHRGHLASGDDQTRYPVR